MRPAHLLRRTKADCYPAQVVCLALSYDWCRTGSGVISETARLSGWVAVCFSGARGEYGKDHVEEGSTADEFWERLRQRTGRHGAATIFCERADLVCSLLDLWGTIERGDVVLGGADERNPRGQRRNGARSPNLRAVLECPPFIIEGKIGGGVGKFKVLGTENYGLQPSHNGVSACERAGDIACFVRGMVATLKLHVLGSLKDTVGTQSYFSFKRSHITHLMPVHNDERALALEGDAYYGGRCEAFRIGRVCGPVYHLDVSSMYPFCAANFAVPVSLSGCDISLGPGDQPQLGEGCGIIADVTLETDEAAYPYRDNERKLTLYPIGRFRTTLAGPELQDALSNDRVVRWHRASWYRMAPALASFAKTVLSLSATTERGSDLRAWLKGMGVCLIGKLGQKDVRWADSTTDNIHGKWSTWYERKGEDQWVRCRSIAGCVQTEERGGWNYDALPAIAAWVCSLARMRLLQMIRCAGWSEVLYIDTDALMVSSAGMTRLERAGWIRPNEPGFLRVKNVSETVEIHGIKAYDEEGRSVRAGQPLSSAGLCAGQVRYWARRSAATACRERRAPEAVRIAIRHDRAEKYRHGEVTATGEVVPFQLNEG